MRDPTGRGAAKNTTRTAEELVNSGDECCRAGVKVRLSMQCEDPIKYPWLRPFHGQEGELIKPIGVGTAWGWLVRFGDVEGTFRTRDVYMLAYANSPATTLELESVAHPPAYSPRFGVIEHSESLEFRRGDSPRAVPPETTPTALSASAGGRMSIGWSDADESQRPVSARTPRSCGRWPTASFF
jgi:hypothetical protein